MVYSHSFVKSTPIPDNAWKEITDRLLLLSVALPDNSTSAGGYYNTEPLAINTELDSEGCFTADDEQIIFNGEGNLAGDIFYFSKAVEKAHCLNACTTGRKPYDLLVCATLVLINHYAGDCVEITSDGDANDWKPALQLVRDVFSDSSVKLPSLITNASAFHAKELMMTMEVGHEWF